MHIGGLADTISTLTHLGARDLDPVLGVFTSGDPVLDTSRPNQFSAYAYAQADPINSGDPSGLFVDGCTVSAPVCAGVATGGGIGAGVFATGGILAGVLMLLGSVLAPSQSQEYLSWYQHQEWASVRPDGIKASNASLQFERSSVWTSPGSSAGGEPTGYGFTPGYSSNGFHGGGFASSGPARVTPSINPFAAAEAAKKSAEAATAAIGNANNAQTAPGTGGGRGTGGPSTTTGFADPGDDDTFSLDKLSEAGQARSKGGMTRAAYEYQSTWGAVNCLECREGS
ncbi:RHS repeat-associated core domain-containing protein [Pseudarthrobacter albicanus]|uniref:RHS repeat-associated core domain-containing protein n=1 Tax=Pseudarthrobacter albicanus TaxID=2823873 RepID=UPI001BAD6AF5